MQQARFPVMGTRAHLLAHGPIGPAALDMARERLDELEQRWSRFLDDSELSAINRTPDVPVCVSPDTFRVITAAIEAWRATEGRFDPTVTMVDAGYDRSYDELRQRDTARIPAPTPAEIVLDPYPSSVTVPTGTALDLGGIAKGAAADDVAGHLLAAGADGVCVNIGGDLRLAGSPPRPEGWRVDLDCPGTDIDLVVGIAEGAVCTSTRLTRVWSGSDGPEHHLRDPATGRPLGGGLATIVVIGSNATQAEVLAKSAFGLGPGGATAELARWGATGVVVTDGGEVLYGPGYDRFRSTLGRAGEDAA